MMGKNNTLGNRIKNRRQALNLSQSELAKQLNCTQAALSQYENSNREPGFQDLINIANVLDTTTDYLLGITDAPTKDLDIKMIVDYLGLSEEAITVLRSHYWEHKRKTLDDYLREDIKTYSGAMPDEEKFTQDYEFLREYHTVDLEDYQKFINTFICSPTFNTISSCLKNNLHIERITFDLLRVASKQYANIKSPSTDPNVAEMTYGLVDDAEDNIRRYSLNLFDAQTSFIDFCKEFTQMESIKKLDYSESFYRKLYFYIYFATRPMFEKNTYSVEAMEKELSESIAPLLPTITKLLHSKE